jgi:hypothetical protein
LPPFARVAGNLDPGYPLDTFGQVGVGEVGDVLGEDAVGQAVGGPACAHRILDARTKAGDDDLLVGLRGALPRVLRCRGLGAEHHHFRGVSGDGQPAAGEQQTERFAAFEAAAYRGSPDAGECFGRRNNLDMRLVAELADRVCRRLRWDVEGDGLRCGRYRPETRDTKARRERARRYIRHDDLPPLRDEDRSRVLTGRRIGKPLFRHRGGKKAASD